MSVISKFRRGEILQGDVLEKIKEIPDNSIDCEITSPPYWGLRDYKVDGQWGLEPDFHDYLKLMQEFMKEMKRVLKSTGTCWINLGDTYASSGGPTRHMGYGDPKYGGKNIVNHVEPQCFEQGIKPKSRFGIPERFYADCIDNGWIARNHIPWIKENSMPSSVKDRFTNKWESVFFFAKNQKYYFNLDAVRIPANSNKDQKPFNLRVREAKRGAGQQKLGDDPRAWKMSKSEDQEYDKRGFKKQDNVLGADGKPKMNYKGFNERWKNIKEKHYDENGLCLGCGEHWSKHTVSERAKGSMSEMMKRTESICWCNPLGKNPGDVFKINPRPFPEAHFATFPVDLPLKILKCACPPNGIVLDPFFGAGTVGVAAEMLGMKWKGIELNPEYITIAKKRLMPFNTTNLDEFS